MSVFFQFQKVCQLKNRTKLKGFIKEIFTAENIRLKSLSYIFCSDEDLLKINKQFLQHDYYTDIITFDLSNTRIIGVVGEIYISIDRVVDNAMNLGIHPNFELHRVIFHGVLHLCGYGDKTKKETLEMRRKEDYYLSTYFNVPRETFGSFR